MSHRDEWLKLLSEIDFFYESMLGCENDYFKSWHARMTALLEKLGDQARLEANSFAELQFGSVRRETAFDPFGNPIPSLIEYKRDLDRARQILEGLLAGPKSA